MVAKPDNRQGNSKKGTDWAMVERLLTTETVRTFYLWGPPGIGKTHTAFSKGRIDRGVFAVTLTEDTSAAELRGQYFPAGGEMVWHDGPFTRAMRLGARLVVNELSHGTPEAHSLLHPVLESIATARLTLPSNETVQPAPGFHVICTDNASPMDLPESLRDRFDSVLEIDEPHPEALALLDEPLRRAAQRSFALEPERRVSLRSWLAIQRLLAEFSLADACRAVLGRERGSQVYEAIVLANANN